uniref:non-specific serine/threonine protein kinase n=1 Tax=Cannabis sativa TaxID=3483 RepID=A0A803PPI0_CANSA
MEDQACTIVKFSWDEIKRFTMNFSTSRVIGSGGFKDEIGGGGALVLEYVSNGSLQEKLHGNENEKTLIPWRKRMAIAAQLAEALEYLHDKCDTSLPVVHGDIKASNVLLDHNLNVKLCDFGSAKMGFSSTVVLNSSTRSNRPRVLMGSPGYTDPHYLRTGIPSKKNDVYSLGVIVLELITGMEPFSSERPTQLLTSLLGPMLNNGDVEEVSGVVDPCLGGEFDPEEAKAMLSLAAQCLRHPPTLRPSAAQILETINNHIPIYMRITNTKS